MAILADIHTPSYSARASKSTFSILRYQSRKWPLFLFLSLPSFPSLQGRFITKAGCVLSMSEGEGNATHEVT
jgi:hypothetical protein